MQLCKVGLFATDCEFVKAPIRPQHFSCKYIISLLCALLKWSSECRPYSRGKCATAVFFWRGMPTSSASSPSVWPIPHSSIWETFRNCNVVIWNPSINFIHSILSIPFCYPSFSPSTFLCIPGVGTGRHLGQLLSVSSWFILALFRIEKWKLKRARRVMRIVFAVSTRLFAG